MQGKSLRIIFAVLLGASVLFAQQSITASISISYWSRTSRYDYRVVNDDQKQFLEMRQTGKKKWARVEELTCTHGHGDYESESFDVDYSCK